MDITFNVEDRRKKGYFTVDNVLLDIYGKQLGPHGIAVYTALARFANGDSECWPSHETVANRTGMSKRQVGREIAKLESLQLIQVVARFDPDTKEHKPNLYILLDAKGIDTLTTPLVTQSIGGMDTLTTPLVTQSIGGMDTLTRPIDTLTRRTIPIKKATPKSNNKKERSYRPAEYADIILG